MAHRGTTTFIRTPSVSVSTSRTPPCDLRASHDLCYGHRQRIVSRAAKPRQSVGRCVPLLLPCPGIFGHRGIASASAIPSSCRAQTRSARGYRGLVDTLIGESSSKEVRTICSLARAISASQSWKACGNSFAITTMVLTMETTSFTPSCERCRSRSARNGLLKEICLSLAVYTVYGTI